MGPDTPDRAALESMLLEYSTKQLVEEVLVAWDDTNLLVAKEVIILGVCMSNANGPRLA